MESILWGLCAAVCIGASDCIARVTSQRISVSVLFLMIMGLSFVVLSFWLVVTSNLPPWHLQAWTASAISGLLNLLALYFLYRALARGPVAVASPAASIFTILLVGLNIVAGEAWSLWQLLAIVIVFLGIGLLARPAKIDSGTPFHDAKWIRTTALLGLATAATVAFRMFLAQEAGSDIGAMHALYLNRLFALLGAVVLIVWCLIRNDHLTWPKGNLRGLVAFQALFETAALGIFLIGSANGGRIGATIGFATFAGITTIFAWIFLHERIGWQRGTSIAIITVGVILAIIGQPD